jgi:hypothetical protein
MKKNIAFLLATMLLATVACAQHGGGDKSKRPSPPASASCKFTDGKSIAVDYSSPRAKGRKIYGDVVPLGKVWRTGANEATTFETTANLSIGSLAIPAGKYTMYTIPGEKSWKLIINKQTGQWGTEYDEKQDLGRADMEVSKTSGPVENFAISFHEMGKGCHIYMDWENTRATVEISEK